MSSIARVLIVDDNAMSRRKMAMAVKNLGDVSVEAESGETALEILGAQHINLMLLDMVMPGIDSFGVLAAVRGDKGFSSIPVLVISGADGEIESVARAIELGATDFLPKNLEPVLFKARVVASLERKRLRDVEVAYLEQVERLSAAAGVVEDGTFDPAELDIGDITERPDGLGKLAAVFVSMAKVVHERERRLRKVITKLDHSYHLSGLALIMFAAALWATVGVASQLLPHVGLMFSVAASVAFVLMLHAARGLSASHPPLLIAGLGLTVTGAFLAPVAYLMLPVGIGELTEQLMDWQYGAVLLYLGLVPTALAYVCYCSGMARSGSAVAGLVASMIEPAVATGLAFLFLREVLSPWEVMGCVLLCSAMLTLWLDEAPRDDDTLETNGKVASAAWCARSVQFTVPAAD